MIRSSALVLAVVLAAPAYGAPVHAAGWPSVALPLDASAFQVGEQLSVDGFPMRMQGFVTRTAPQATADWFRRSMGAPLVENRLLGKLVLGQARGDYYVSVLLEALPDGRNGTRGTVTVSNLKSAWEQRDSNRAHSDRLLARLPYGTRIVSQVSSTEHGRATAYVVAENGNSEDVNREHLVRQLAREGYALEREGRPAEARAAALPDALARGRTLFFKGRAKEAMAVIRPASTPGRTSIALQTVNTMERLQ